MSQPSPGMVQAVEVIARINRRDFLHAALAIVGSASVGGLGFSEHSYAAANTATRVMSTSEFAVFERLMTIMFPNDGSSLIPASQIPVMQTLDEALLGAMAPNILAGLKAGVEYFDHGPVGRYGKRFVELDDVDAVRFCDEWANAAETAQRALAIGLKKLVGLAYWASPSTWVPLGYDGPVTGKWGLKPLGNAPMPRQSS